MQNASLSELFFLKYLQVRVMNNCIASAMQLVKIAGYLMLKATVYFLTQNFFYSYCARQEMKFSKFSKGQEMLEKVPINLLARK